jgi:sulfate transport system permease protein
VNSITLAAVHRHTARDAVLPGLRLALGFTLVWLGLIVVVPLTGLVAKAAQLNAAGIAGVFGDPRTLAAFRLSFGGAAAAALIDVPLGLLLAWALTRYRFPGHRLVDALIDLPFALPTAVAGIALTTLYVDDGWIGGLLAPLGIHLAFTPAGVVVALTFVGLPFIVRTVQPVLADLDRDAEEVALTLGAQPLDILRRVLVPPITPALLTGVALAFARGVGEYGSVIFIAGNRPAVSEIVPLLIVARLEQFDYPAAAVLGTGMLLLSLLMLLALNALQRGAGSERRPAHAA